MKFFKSHFALSRSQQNGIFVLVLIIIILQVILFIDFSSAQEFDKNEDARLEAFKKQLDSLNSLNVKQKDTFYPFNPNYLTDFKGYQLGMSVAEIDRLLAYRKNGKWVNTGKEFQEVTGVSDSLLKKIAPSFRFPEWVKERERMEIEKKISTETTPVISDLNLANAEDLKTINGIGEVLSERIVKYRSSIGGFLDPVQLKDVYGLSPEVIERINQRFRLLSKPDISIKNINAVSEAELAEIPYFNSSLVRDIITYRKLHEGISSFDELSKINNFPSDKIDRIKLYLTIE